MSRNRLSNGSSRGLELLHSLGLKLSDLEYQSATDSDRRDSNERRTDMQSPIGIWKERVDLPDCELYVRALREDNRRTRSLPA